MLTPREERNRDRLPNYQAQLRSLTLEVALAQEKERRRIALGLHDEVGHSLALARMKLGELRRRPGAGRDPGLAQVCAFIDHAIQATRGLTFDLSCPILYELGLEAALECVGERMVAANGVHFALESDGLSKPMSGDARIVLYRSVSELLLNAVKHARASSVRIDLRRASNRIEITVADDGIGFDSTEISRRKGRTGGFGLLSVREQLWAIGGRFEVDSAPGEGTICLIMAPLESSVE